MVICHPGIDNICMWLPDAPAEGDAIRTDDNTSQQGDAEGDGEGNGLDAALL